MYLIKNWNNVIQKGCIFKKYFVMKRDFSCYSWSLIKLNRKLKFSKTYCHDKNSIVGEVTEPMKKECEGTGQLLCYRAMHHEIRQVHGLNVTSDQVYAAMTDVDLDELENRKPILKKKKTKGMVSSVGPN